MGARLEFKVYGTAQTAGSKVAVPMGARYGVQESGDRKAKGQWRADIRAAAHLALAALPDVEAAAWPADGPVRVTFTFHRERPKGHYGTGRNAGVLKASAPRWPVARPDVLKTARAVEDALTSKPGPPWAVWADDARIVVELLVKVYGDVEHVHVVVEQLEDLPMVAGEQDTLV